MICTRPSSSSVRGDLPPSLFLLLFLSSVFFLFRFAEQYSKEQPRGMDDLDQRQKDQVGASKRGCFENIWIFFYVLELP